MLKENHLTRTGIICPQQPTAMGSLGGVLGRLGRKVPEGAGEEVTG